MHGRIKVIHVATAGANIAGRRTSTLAFLIYMKTQIQIQIGDRLQKITSKQLTYIVFYSDYLVQFSVKYDYVTIAYKCCLFN